MWIMRVKRQSHKFVSAQILLRHMFVMHATFKRINKNLSRGPFWLIRIFFFTCRKMYLYGSTMCSDMLKKIIVPHVVLCLCPGVGLSWHCAWHYVRLPAMHEVTIPSFTWLCISISFPVWWFDSPRVLMAPKASLIGKLPGQQIQVLQRKRPIQTKRQSSKLAPHNRVSHNKKKEIRS